MTLVSQFLLVSLVLIFFWIVVYIAGKVGEKTAEPYVKMIEDIDEQDIPLNEKLEKIKKVKELYHKKYS